MCLELFSLVSNHPPSPVVPAVMEFQVQINSIKTKLQETRARKKQQEEFIMKVENQALKVSTHLCVLFILRLNPPAVMLPQSRAFTNRSQSARTNGTCSKVLQQQGASASVRFQSRSRLCLFRAAV